MPARRPSLARVAREIARLEGTYDFVSLREVDVAVDESGLVVGGREYPAEPALVVAELGAPEEFVVSLPEALRSRVILNEIKRAKPRALVSGGGKFVRFDHRDAARLKASQALEQIVAAAGKRSLRVESFDVRDHVVSVDLVSYSIRGNVSRGRTVTGGIALRHSLTGASPTEIHPFLYLDSRLPVPTRICPKTRLSLSWAFPEVSAEETEITDPESARHVASEVFAVLGRQIEWLRKLAQTHPPYHPSTASERQRYMRSLVHRYLGSLKDPLDTQDVRSLLRRQVEKAPYCMPYGAMSALVAIAYHAAVAPRTRDRLLRVAGIFALSKGHSCCACYDPLGGLRE